MRAGTKGQASFGRVGLGVFGAALLLAATTSGRAQASNLTVPTPQPVIHPSPASAPAPQAAPAPTSSSRSTSSSGSTSASGSTSSSVSTSSSAASSAPSGQGTTSPEPRSDSPQQADPSSHDLWSLASQRSYYEWRVEDALANGRQTLAADFWRGKLGEVDDQIAAMGGVVDNEGRVLDGEISRDSPDDPEAELSATFSSSLEPTSSFPEDPFQIEPWAEGVSTPGPEDPVVSGLMFVAPPPWADGTSVWGSTECSKFSGTDDRPPDLSELSLLDALKAGRP